MPRYSGRSSGGVEAQSVLFERLGHARISGRILCDQQRGGMAVFEPLVHHFEKGQRVSVDTACRVALPVDQAGDRVHAQTVKVELLEPVIGRRLQKAPHLAPRVDEVIAAPLAFAHSDVRVFVERCAVIPRKAIAVHCKMHGHKVHDRADARLMQAVDQGFELGGRAVARGRSKKSCILVAPRAVERMLGQGQEFDVRKPVFLQIGDEQVSDLIVAVPAVFVIRAAPPRAEVHFIDVQRRVGRCSAIFHPFRICEGIFV